MKLKKKKTKTKVNSYGTSGRLSGIGVSKEGEGETLKKYFLKVARNFPT